MLIQGGHEPRNFGLVLAHFVRQETTADEAIRQRLAQLGHDARNWIVVSSDRSVQTAARAAKARTLQSDTFATQLGEILTKTDELRNHESEKPLSTDEVENWMRVFKSKPSKK